jgi:hypothetical protein
MNLALATVNNDSSYNPVQTYTNNQPFIPVPTENTAVQNISVLAKDMTNSPYIYIGLFVVFGYILSRK